MSEWILIATQLLVMNLLNEVDRVEIYRAITADPATAERRDKEETSEAVD